MYVISSVRRAIPVPLLGTGLSGSTTPQVSLHRITQQGAGDVPILPQFVAPCNGLDDCSFFGLGKVNANKVEDAVTQKALDQVLTRDYLSKLLDEVRSSFNI